MSQLTVLAGCDNSRFFVVPDWYANGCCRVLALVYKLSILNVYLVLKIRFIKYRFLKSMFIDYEVEKEAQLQYTNNRLQRFFVPSVQLPRHLRHMIYTN
jgi:hypothetical protein